MKLDWLLFLNFVITSRVLLSALDSQNPVAFPPKENKNNFLNERVRRRSRDEESASSTSKLHLGTPIFNRCLTNVLSEASKLIKNYAESPAQKSKLIAVGMMAGVLICKPFVKDPESKHFRFGSVMTTTASICFDYRWCDFRRMNLSECHERSAVKLGKLFAGNGGLYIKVAQHMSSMDHLLPRVYIEELSKLQDKAPISPLTLMEEIFKEEFGVEMREVFSEINPVPIGSASIGQVHVARMRSTGQLVAIKMQHPRIKRDSEVDLRALRFALNLVKLVFPDFNFDWLVEEIRDCLECELNFKKEAENSKICKALFSKHPKLKSIVWVPEVYDEFTSERILTMEYVPGIKLTNLRALEEKGIEPLQVNRLVYEIFTEMIFKFNFVHCDPHPGNILVVRSGKMVKIVILDHGIYKTVSPEMVKQFSSLFLAIFNDDVEKIQKLATEFGISPDFLKDLRMLVERSHRELTKNSGNPEVANARIRENVLKFMAAHQDESSRKQASEAFEKIPRELFFIVKIFDVLRSNERKLTAKASKNKIPDSLLILIKSCTFQVEGKCSAFSTVGVYCKVFEKFLRDLMFGR